MSAVDMHLSLGQIQGGSQDDAFDSAIDIISWEWELSQGGSMHVGSGGGVGKVSVGDLKITKLIDRSSPIFTLMCCQGKHFENAELSARKAGGDAGQVQFHY
ncbi:type VI secretion system tube protein Hcp, partial [Photobacterium sanctipauli]